jgi:hypothetical protein
MQSDVEFILILSEHYNHASKLTLLSVGGQGRGCSWELERTRNHLTSIAVTVVAQAQAPAQEQLHLELGGNPLVKTALRI